jgi:transposase
MLIYKEMNSPIVNIDEVGFSGDNFRTHGYSFRGQRCFDTYDWGKKNRVNAIGALLNGRIIAPALFETSINKIIFSEWIINDLLPELIPNSIICMDNASFHKCKQMQEAIESAGHKLEYFPTYSPDLNPIEHVWAQAKKIRKKYNCSVDDIFTKYLI